MAGSAPAYLLDTNVLLRLYQPNSPEFSAIRSAVTSLLVVAYGVAAMIVHEVHHILTLDGRDFGRYTEIVAVHPQNVPA